MLRSLRQGPAGVAVRDEDADGSGGGGAGSASLRPRRRVPHGSGSTAGAAHDSSARAAHSHAPSGPGTAYRVVVWATWLNIQLDVLVLALLSTFILAKAVFYVTSAVVLPTLRGVAFAFLERAFWAAVVDATIGAACAAVVALRCVRHVGVGRLSTALHVAKALYCTLDFGLCVCWPCTPCCSACTPPPPPFAPSPTL